MRFLLTLLLLLSPSLATAQELGMGTGRSHPEFRWLERESEHFLFVYPEHLESVALEAASVAEQVYGPILAGLEMESLSQKTCIVLSDEDEIVNGFALPGKMFLWVNVNDYITWEAGNARWMRMLLAHEFQHDAWFEAAGDWTGMISLLGTPAWVVEGMAEYETEPWDSYRSDLKVRQKVLANRIEKLDPHNSGFSRVRYLAETYGDSVLLKAIKHRNRLGLASFGKGFRKAAGISLEDFEEEWRRAASAWTYASFGQKEAIDEIGESYPAPLTMLDALVFSADSSRMAVLGRASQKEGKSLFVIANDSTKTRRKIDDGWIGLDFAFSPDAKKLVYEKKHRVAHGGILPDLKVADLESGKSHWISSARRAQHPAWSPDGASIAFVGNDGNRSNLYLCSPEGKNVRALTDFPHETRLLSPAFSPEGDRIAFSLFEAEVGVNIGIWSLPDSTLHRLTDHPGKDLRPLWSEDGERIYFTGHRSEWIPNLYTVPADGNESGVECMTDTGEALWASDLLPGGNSLVAGAMNSMDTLRLRKISLNRRVQQTRPALAARYRSWTLREPPNPVPPIDYDRIPSLSEAKPYSSWRHLRHFATYPLPALDFQGAGLFSIWMDAAHRQRWILALDTGMDDGNYTARGAWVQMERMFRPGFLGFELWKNSRWGNRYYNNALLCDLRDGFHLWCRYPMNFGEHLYANHELKLEFRDERIEVSDFSQHDSWDPEDSLLPEPEVNYREKQLALSWVYSKTPPISTKWGHARAGHALRSSLRFSDKALGSDFDYLRLDLDGWKVQKLPFGQLFGRVRAASLLSGEVPAQDFVGLSADPGIFPRSGGEMDLLHEIQFYPDNFNPRGLKKSVPGRWAALASLELQAPLLPPLPLSAFGFSPGGMTGLLFLEEAGVGGEGDTDNWRGAGWEIRLPWRFAGQTLLFPSYGQAWDLGDWESGPVDYFRLAAVRPF
ncbi:MAG: hypothetical protein QF492_02105 [Candidatus Krumholzibacteria bacterium]|nr:hypothetical protein [Candidatus Krumholzibacteria bacterium]MDP6668688.1 hypothetical protein [Candidatus Krumholzibacteria bacterium]MDP7021781.1 hypothetical protein [Candidatus Krumholzibacteria bacterium]